MVTVPKEERVQLAEGEYFLSDLIGCTVFDRASGQTLGEVSGYQETGGPVLLEVGEHLVPFHKDLYRLVDVAGKRIEVELPEGFLDMNK